MILSRNLREDYQLLHFLETTDPWNYEEWIKDVKLRIRNTHRERAQREAEEIYNWKCYRNNWDSRYCRIEYDGVMTEEEIKEYIEEEWWHWYNPYGDGRDCTGVMFTTGIDVFPIPALNKTIVYHFQTMDV